MNRPRLAIYLCVLLAVAALAAVEFAHEYAHGDAPDGALCVTPENRREALREMLIQHMRGH